MIHYHGTPVGGKRQDVAKFLQGRHALVPFPRQDDIGIVAEVCKSFVFDNGAFSVWKRGGSLDIDGYKRWVKDWYRHPGFQWALIPDVIDGDEADNDALIEDWRQAGLALYGVPVWHLHESLERLLWLAQLWSTVALGSSGAYKHPGSLEWWKRIGEAMTVLCPDGKPFCKIHGLRMMDPKIFTRVPFSSVDSTNAGMNSGSLKRFGTYVPPTAGQRAVVIADRIEAHNSAAIWLNPSKEEP